MRMKKLTRSLILMMVVMLSLTACAGPLAGSDTTTSTEDQATTGTHVIRTDDDLDLDQSQSDEEASNSTSSDVRPPVPMQTTTVTDHEPDETSAADPNEPSVQTSDTSSSVSDSTELDETTVDTPETTILETTAAPTTSSSETADTTQATKPQTNDVTLMIDASIAAQAGLAGVPDDGIFLPETVFALEKDESVADLLIRAGREHNIAVAVRGSGQMTFISSIAGITGTNSRSGWMYSINGEYIMTGSGQYRLSPGDRVIWHFTMDSGQDLP